MNKMTRNEIVALYERGKKEGFAIPAFNYSDIWDMMAIVKAAEEAQSPVLLMCDPPTYEEFGGRLCAAMADVVIERANVPVIHHLVHSESPENCLEAMEYGFNSVMMDASNLPIDGNIAAVHKVVEKAREKGVFVEAEIGRIRGDSSYETSYTGDDYLFLLEEAKRLVEESGCDSLAIGIGNAHGFYQGEPEINFGKLKEANDNLDIPLVLHGGTGIPRDVVRKCIAGGIRKVNVGTAVYCAYMNGAREKLMADGENQFTYDVMEVAMDSVKKEVAYWIETCNAVGKAAK